MSSRTLKVNIVIHGFAAAHLVCVLIARSLGFSDDIILSLLTIAMVIIITRIYNMPLEVTAVITLLALFAGFYIGTKGADLVASVRGGSPSMVDNALVSFGVTEILGWATYLLSRRKRRSNVKSKR